MDIDPRRHRSLLLVRRLYRILKKQDEYLNRDMANPGKKSKKDITLVDLTDDKYPQGKVIKQSEVESSEDEDCTHLAFLNPAAILGDESGDEDNYDKDGNLLIVKIEPSEHPEVQAQHTPQTTTVGVLNQNTEPVSSPKGKGKGKGKSSRRQ